MNKIEKLKEEIKLIEDNIIVVNGNPCLLDSSVAKFYGVATRTINQAVKRNIDRFPKGYILELEKDMKIRLLNGDVTNCDIMDNIKYSRVPNKIFTEKGLYMLATILKGERATKVTLNIIETFTKFRNITNDLIEANKTKDDEKKAEFLARSEENLINLLTEELEATTTNIKTTIKLDLGVFKIEKTIEKEKK